MKKSMFFVFACTILFACDTAIEEPDDMLLLKSKSLSFEHCENVRVQGVFDIGGLLIDTEGFNLNFSGMTCLLNALKDAGAFIDHPEYGYPMAWTNVSEVTGLLGAIPIEMTIAGVEGMLGSFVTHRYATNELENSAVFYHLFHLFWSEDRENAFVTWDHAVQSPVNKKNNTARINNKLEVLAGTGVFKNATGTLINNGMINYNTFKIHANVHGRICGEGIGKEH